MRVPWRRNFPPVFVHAAWDSPAARVLPEHPGYFRAKKRRDVMAALAICDDLAQEGQLEAIYDTCFERDADLPPLVVAPSLALEETQNVLALTYAQWLAKEMGWEVEKGIFRANTASRDFIVNPWYRLAHDPTYYGAVQPGRRYVIADDVSTMGGTLTSLRGFIESQGATVICMTALASKTGDNVQISLAERTLRELTMALSGRLAAACNVELGYAVNCLTEQEGRFLLRCPSVDALRAGIAGARDP